ncbi:MAG TPA: hypothetical protein VIY68_03865 [Steroidobacteraceae bacterium]
MEIYLEAKPVYELGINTGYWHLYLVERPAPQSDSEFNSLAWRNEGNVLRGGSTISSDTLSVQSGALATSSDAYNSSSDISNRLIWNITDLVGGDSGWATMSSMLAGIGAADYPYELPFGRTYSNYYVANSDAVVTSLLNAVGVDVRSIIGSLDAPGAGTGVQPTLLGDANSTVIQASPALQGGVTLLASPNVNDTLIGNGNGDNYFGYYNSYPINFQPKTIDTVSYQNSTVPVVMTINGQSATPVTVQVANGTDQMFGIEKVILSPYNDTVLVTGLPPQGLQEVDGGGTQGGGSDTLDLTALGHIIFNDNKIVGTNTVFEGFNRLLADPGNVNITLDGSDEDSYNLVDLGNGNDTITSTVPGLTIDLGNGNNLVGSVGPGTIVNVQSNGVDQFIPSADVLINGSTASDQLIGGNGVLHGAVGEVGSQDPWVVGPNQARYSINVDGDLVVQTPFEAAMNNGMTFISGYVGGPDVPLSEQTDGIFVGLAKIEVSLLVDLTRPFNEDIPTWFKLGNELYYTSTGTTIFNADPLVFDLTGGGINLTALSSVAPMLDVEDTG